MSVTAKSIPQNSPDESSSRRIAILGMYGWGNLGNECTLEALAANLRQKEPGISLTAICPGPGDVRDRHGMDAIPFDSSSNGANGERLDGALGRILRPFRILFRRVPEEIFGLRRAVRIMRAHDMLLIGGTGILEDNSSWSLEWIWNLTKWVLAAKRSSTAVAFVSIGAGPIHRPVDRWFIKRVLRSADYVSYRDDYSIDYMSSTGLATDTHRRFPDLAFGLPVLEGCQGDKANKTVAVGVMQYYGQRSLRVPDDSVYETYVCNMAEFIQSLLDEGFDVKILYGDARYDLGIVADLQRSLRGYSGTSQLSQAQISEVDDVVRELADSRFVVASRYHNLILSLMLGKPTISISYHDKNDDLLAMFGFGDYCHDIDSFNCGQLMEQFHSLVRNEPELESHILGTAARLRTEIDRQYDLLLGLPARQPGSSAGD